MKSMILLEMKCPQLSKPEVTEARNQNSIGDRMEKKPLEKPGSVGGPVPLRPDEPVVCSNCSKVRVRLIWKLLGMCVGAGLEHNSAGRRPSSNWVWHPCPNPFKVFTLRSESFEWLKGVGQVSSNISL